MKIKRYSDGFTLTEIMIVVVVISILAAIAYPSYIDSIRKARRSDAVSELMKVAQKMEVFYARNAAYTQDLTLLGYDNVDYNDILSDSGTVTYRMNIIATGGCDFSNCYTIQAQSQNDQLKDKFDRFRLYHSGRKQRRVKGGAWEDGWSGN